jgi:hypothetical protein
MAFPKSRQQQLSFLAASVQSIVSRLPTTTLLIDQCVQAMTDWGQRNESIIPSHQGDEKSRETVAAVP